METPSSTRRITRSQTAAASSNNKNIPISKKIEDSDQGGRQRNGKQHQERSALIDITNDSPIVGLAAGSLRTPSSSVIKTRTSRPKSTPGSGEALLRCQVKTLLQKVEEEAELSKLSLERHPFPPSHLQGFANSSPMGLVAPTPANTPQVLSISGSDSNAVTTTTDLAVVASSQPDEEHMVSKVVNDIFYGNNEGSLESEKSLITRSLLLDFSDKSENTDSSDCLSVLSFQGVEIDGNNKEKSSTEFDSSSVWSIQANASTHDDEDDDSFVDNDDIEEEEGYDYYHEEEDEEGTYGGGLMDELCIGMTKMCVNENRLQFQGKHTRFVYNSDDEIVDAQEEEEDCGGVSSSPNVLRLKGLPTPKGKHVRFEEGGGGGGGEEEEEGK